MKSIPSRLLIIALFSFSLFGCAHSSPILPIHPAPQEATAVPGPLRRAWAGKPWSGVHDEVLVYPLPMDLTKQYLSREVSRKNP